MSLCVSSAATVADLDTIFTAKIDSIDICVGLVSANCSESRDQVAEVKQALVGLRQEIAYLRSCIEEGKRNLEQSQKLLPSLAALNARMRHMCHNLPPRLPTLSQSQQDVQPNSQSQQSNHHRPRPHLPSLGPITEDDVNSVAPPSTTKPTKSIPQFQYITTDEFEEVPKYVRGRLQYQQVNRIVEEMNKTLAAKYGLLRRQRAKLSLPDMKLVNTIRAQATDQTKGRHFVTVDDLKRWSSAKVGDSSCRSALGVLRTAHKTQEIRGPGTLLRYAVPQS